MTMTFAERMALRKKEAAQGTPNTPLTTTVEASPLNLTSDLTEGHPTNPTKEPVKKWGTKKFGAPKEPVDLDNSSASNPKPTLSDALSARMNSVAEPAPANKMNTFPLTKIITMNNIAGQAAPTEGELLIAGEMPEDAIRIKQRISMLSSIEEGTLKSEMDELKKLIKAAPEACQYLLPEELGQVVRALRSMTDNKLAIDLGRAKPRKTKDTIPKLTAADLKDLEF